MISVVLAASLMFSNADAQLAYNTVKELVEECTPRDAGTIRGRIAANKILDCASSVGIDVRRDFFTAKTPNGERQFVNLYGEFKSDDTNRWVVLISHYDTKPGIKCPGANDGASTTGLLVGLAQALVDWETPRGNVLFVWTDGEECCRQYSANDGLQGSRRAVEWIKERNIPVQAVICLDMLGDRNLNIKLPQNGNATLAKIAMHAARRQGLKGLISQADEIVTDDHVPFLENGYKAIDLIDFEYGSKPGLNDYWHTDKDTMDKISVESLEKSGRLVAEMLNILL
jgi:Zn-dependent M28 family amino/carboxypeptidase